MRIAKLFAYLALAIFLPLWLYKLSDNELTESKKRQAENDSNKPEDSKLIVALLSKPTQINFNSSHLDSLFYHLAKSNQSKTSDNRPPSDTPNKQLERSVQNLVDISTVNTTNLQGLLSKDRDIKVSVSPIEINPKTDNRIELQKNFPIYNLNENGPLTTWIIDLKDSLMPNDGYFLLFHNSSLKYEAYIDSIIVDGQTINEIFSNYNASKFPKSTLPQQDLSVNFFFQQRQKKLFFIVGHFAPASDRKSKKIIQFRIPLIISRTVK